MTAVERLKEYEDHLPSEVRALAFVHVGYALVLRIANPLHSGFVQRTFDDPKAGPGPNEWPTKGSIEFKGELRCLVLGVLTLHGPDSTVYVSGKQMCGCGTAQAYPTSCGESRFPWWAVNTSVSSVGPGRGRAL